MMCFPFSTNIYFLSHVTVPHKDSPKKDFRIKGKKKKRVMRLLRYSSKWQVITGVSETDVFKHETLFSPLLVQSVPLFH